MPTVYLLMGLQASGKSRFVKTLSDKGYVVLNRDSTGGSLGALVPKMKELLAKGQKVALDNTFLTPESRAPFIAAAHEMGHDIECWWMDTSFEDCLVNACNRMWDRYGQVFMDADAIKAHPVAAKDPNIFPIAALFAGRNKLAGDKKKGIPSTAPTNAEGFSKVISYPFIRAHAEGTAKAIILDYDGTLRDDARNHGGQHPYPTMPSEVVLLPNRSKVLQSWKDKGYLLLGASTQSGIGKGHMSREDAEAAFKRTNELLGFDIPVSFCPHHNFPVACYCRKPQPGMGVALIREHDLDPAECIFVGDRTEDKTFAQRCGFQFQWADGFFKP